MIDYSYSKTGRKKRKDSFEAEYDIQKIQEKLNYLYIDRQLSTNKIPMVMEKEYGIKISSSKCYSIIRDMGIMRGRSDSISLATSTLDYNKSYFK